LLANRKNGSLNSSLNTTITLDLILYAQLSYFALHHRLIVLCLLHCTPVSDCDTLAATPNHFRCSRRYCGSRNDVFFGRFQMSAASSRGALPFLYRDSSTKNDGSA